MSFLGPLQGADDPFTLGLRSGLLEESCAGLG